MTKMFLVIIGELCQPIERRNQLYWQQMALNAWSVQMLTCNYQAHTVHTLSNNVYWNVVGGLSELPFCEFLSSTSITTDNAL